MLIRYSSKSQALDDQRDSHGYGRVPTVEAVDHLHPLALTLLDVLLLESVLPLNELGLPALDSVFLTQTIYLLVHVCTSDLDIRFVVTSYFVKSRLEPM
jgi:hypothetical protein